MKRCWLLLSVFLSLSVAQAHPRPSGQTLFSQYLQDGTYRLSQNALWNDQVQRVGQRLAEVCGTDLHWQFYLVDEKTPMACAPGDGVVVISEGLLRVGLSDDEVAGLLGHEMAHEVQGHVVQLPEDKDGHEGQEQAYLTNLKVERERLTRECQRWAALGASADETWEWLVSLNHEVTQLQKVQNARSSVRKLQKQSNHRCEFVADSLGRQYAVLAGYHPDGLAQALGKVLRSCPAVLTGESLTHPSLAARLRQLNPTRRTLRRHS